MIVLTLVMGGIISCKYFVVFGPSKPSGQFRLLPVVPPVMRGMSSLGRPPFAIKDSMYFAASVPGVRGVPGVPGVAGVVGVFGVEDITMPA
jgi:hypothetical protein